MVNLARAAKKVGPQTVCREALLQVWGSRRFLGLRRDLGTLPASTNAESGISMKAVRGRPFAGFEQELRETTGRDHLTALKRRWLLQAGVQTAYCATDAAGSPLFVQWLVTAETQRTLHADQPRRYPILKKGQVILEGTYTFKRFRRAGVATAATLQLLHIAGSQGASCAFMYVAVDNVAALRSAANAGFTLDHMRVNTRRLGLLTSTVRPFDEAASRVWNAAARLQFS